MKLKVKNNINDYSIIIGKNLCSKINRIIFNERIYSHLADISSLALLDTIQETLADKKLDTKLITSARESYVRTVDVKKVDVGGGLIHGEPDDFKNDKSKTIGACHGQSCS